MLKANQAKEITEKAIEKEIMEKETKALEFCENLSNEIERVANLKESSLNVQDIPRNLYSFIVKILKDNGYQVTLLDNTTITVIW